MENSENSQGHYADRNKYIKQIQKMYGHIKVKVDIHVKQQVSGNCIKVDQCGHA